LSNSSTTGFSAQAPKPHSGSTAAKSAGASDRGPRNQHGHGQKERGGFIVAPDASKPALFYDSQPNSTLPEQTEMTITIYGIKNCDTMKKARGWLDSHGVAYDFHDYKAEGITQDKLKQWCDQLGWEILLNRAGTTFRKLPDGDKEDLNARKAIALMLAQPSMIKRPVLDLGGHLLVGFKPEIYAREVAPAGGRRKSS
jgi:arsenate reductase (glutaredoxin)